MALTDSTMLPLGTQAPPFALTDTEGRTVRALDFSGRPLLVVFMCNHCPYVKHIAEGLANFAAEYQKKGVAIIGINSNDSAHYPDDSPEKMRNEVKLRGYTFPYLVDASQEVAHAYRAACTPDFFLFDAQHRLVYRGQFDDTRPRRIASGVYDHGAGASGADLRAAADAVLCGKPVTIAQRPSSGCNIKWKPRNEPQA